MPKLIKTSNNKIMLKGNKLAGINNVAPENIKNGVTIFGVTGNYTGEVTISQVSATITNSECTIANVTRLPSMIIIESRITGTRYSNQIDSIIIDNVNNTAYGYAAPYNTQYRYPNTNAVFGYGRFLISNEIIGTDLVIKILPYTGLDYTSSKFIGNYNIWVVY